MSGRSDDDHDDSDGSKENDLSEAEEKDPEEGGGSRRRKKAKVVREITFEEALKVLDLVADNMSGEGSTSGTSRNIRRTRSKQKKIKVAWVEVAAAMAKEAEVRGLSNEIIRKIWAILSNSHTKVPPTHASKLILSGIPQSKPLNKEEIEDIILRIPCFQQHTKLAIVKYLFGLSEYNLCDLSGFEGFFYYSTIFFLGTTSVMIPWVCALVKKITKPYLIQKSFINDLMDLLHTPLNMVSLRSIVDLLRYFKLLRPDLLPNNVSRMGVIGVNKKVVLNEGFQKGLYNSKIRMSEVLSNQMDIEDNDASPEEVLNFLKFLNDNCFPEFLLHHEGDPEPNDIKALLKLNPYNLMRCSLRTAESLPFIINNPEALEHFNSYVSLIFQHKFDTYDEKLDKKYTFILKRCRDISILSQHGLPAVNEWLIDYMWFWDGLLFKEYIFELLRFLTLVDFSDDCRHVLQKLETLFMFGEPLDRIEVWEILVTICGNWIEELYLLEAEDESLEPMKKSISYLLNFIHSLVGKVATFNGHEDKVFLIHCCKGYSQLSFLANDGDKPLFCVYPPYSLWCMVVLNDSVTAIDKFCEFVHTHMPERSLEHLRDTDQYKFLEAWRKELLPEVFIYFGLKSSIVVPFQNLFLNEIKNCTDNVEKEQTGGGISREAGEQCGAVMTELFSDLSTFTAATSKGLQEILIDSRRHGKQFSENLDIDKAKELAPNIVIFLERNETESEISDATTAVLSEPSY